MIALSFYHNLLLGTCSYEAPTQFRSDRKGGRQVPVVQGSRTSHARAEHRLLVWSSVFQTFSHQKSCNLRVFLFSLKEKQEPSKVYVRSRFERPKKKEKDGKF